MRVLITGGTGVIGQGVIEALVARGQQVRLISRHAAAESREWPNGVEGIDADVGDPASLLDKARECDVVVHIAGIVAEKPPEVTFEKVNVAGTRNIISEARRAGVRRFIYMSSLGADKGASPYHQSKRAAENLVRESGLDWTIVRPGNVYGPGDEVVSLVLKMVRALPAVPVIDNGDQPFQPVWFRDLGEAVARVVEREDVSSKILEVAGIETTTMNEVIERFSALTGRTPLRLPVPGFLAKVTASAMSGLGIDAPIDENKLQMLYEENVIRGENALVGTLAMKATPLGDGLAALIDMLPEKLPSEGVGTLREKRFWVDIRKSTYNRQELFERFRNGFSEAMPIDVGVEAAVAPRLEEGATITMKLPLRGNIQVRVEKVTSSTIVLSTVQGHPVAGFVRFDFRNHEGMIRFEVRVVDRSGSFFDLFAMETVGQVLQDRNWEAVVERVLADSGGEAVEGIQSAESVLTDAEAQKAEAWAEEIVIDRKRREREDDSDREQRL